jgi:predicted P-loop ATPase
MIDPTPPTPPHPHVLFVPPPFHQAKALIAAGFRVLPLAPVPTPPGGFLPAVDGFGAECPDFTCGLEWFGEPDGAVALLLGPCPALPASEWIICIDIDGDPASHPELASWLATLPPTLTGHGGRHLYYRVSASVGAEITGPAFKRRGIAHDGIDVKGAGGYVRARWTWSAPPAPAAIAPLPAPALAGLLAARARPGAAAPALPAAAPALADTRGPDALRAAGFDPAQVREDAKAWLLRQAPLPTPGGGDGGVTMLVVFGGLMVGFGLDDETSLELAIDVYAPRAWPDEEPDEDGFQHKIDEIDRHGSERFQVPLELAIVAREVRRGAALTRPDLVTAALAALPVPAGDAAGDGAEGPSALERAEERLRTLDFRLARNQEGELKNNAFNTALVLELHPMCAGLFGYDEFTHNVVFLRDCEAAELRAPAGAIFDEDHHATALQVWFARYFHEPNKAALIDAVHLIARERPFHAVRAYLDQVRALGWDGIDRNLVDYLGAEPTVYHRAVCAKWLRSAVARAMVPGSQSDNMLILEGRQGLRKSTALKCLCPDVRWFYAAASRMVGSKDFMQDMNGKWLCEIPEVDQLISSRDESELKALLTRTSDNYRPSYARKSSDFPRQLVFAGTTNRDDYLRDPTGNRRYWAVECGITGPVQIAKLCDDRDQIWAQAFHEYASGLPWHLDPEEEGLAAIEQEARLEDDPWVDHLWTWIAERPDPIDFTVYEALSALPGAKPVADQTQADLNRIGKVLRKMGLVCRRKRVGTDRLRVWCLP